MASTFLASDLRVLGRLLEARGIDSRSFFQSCKLDPDRMNDPTGRFDTWDVWTTVAKVSEQLEDPDIGLESIRYQRLTDHHLFGITVAASATIQDALHRIVRYQHIENTTMNFSLDQAGDLVHLRLDTAGQPDSLARLLEDWRASTVMFVLRVAGGANFNPHSACFSYPEPNDTQLHQALFRCPLTFDADCLTLSFDQETANQQLDSDNKAILLANEPLLERFVAQLTKDDFRSQVRMAIIDELAAGYPRDENIAATLNMSVRTMQRKLSELGTHFTDVLTEVRHELAERYVGTTDMPITEIGLMLGFAETSSFSRAFKRWTGKSPGDYRARR